MLVPGSILYDRYRIVRILGRGREGLAYEAIDERLSSRVAIREVNYSNQRAVKGFTREAELQTGLYHRALPKVWDFFVEGHSQYLVMDFIPGTTLADLLYQRGTPFPTEEVLNWTDQLLHLLDYVHHQAPPIILCSIKPDNLKLAGRDTVVLVDYGLAQRIEREHLADEVKDGESLLGYTPTFVPPEQIRGKVDERSDLYSVAASMYFLLTGLLPADGLTRLVACMDGARDPLLRIDQVDPKIQAGLASLLMQAMAVDPQDRPSSAADMRERLKEVEGASGSEASEVTSSNSSQTSKRPPDLRVDAPVASLSGGSESILHAGSERGSDSYEVFISYRRRDGSSEARLIRAELLRQKEIRAFLDVDDLGAGHFDEALLKRIANIPNFIVVLSANCLERCSDEGDWLRQEIVQALVTNKKIIPVMLPGFQFPELQTLPDDLRTLSSHQSVYYSHDYFDAMIAKIFRYLRQN